MSTVEEFRSRIAKLRGAENYRTWSIQVQTELEAKLVWDIITGERLKRSPPIPQPLEAKSVSEGPEDSTPKPTQPSDEHKAAYNEWTKSNATAKAIIVINSDVSIITDDYVTACT
jgi:hypothetical protein